MRDLAIPKADWPRAITDNVDAKIFVFPLYRFQLQVLDRACLLFNAGSEEIVVWRWKMSWLWWWVLRKNKKKRGGEGDIDTEE
ncbi:unnamed protein product [Eruca vesicaria subsp. sativa]|uniref:Uncharacterized protein n=1 Tax=Eruca vesicaria subsp. sativa TaxID=29727 RepID=A0ABC8J6V1_ERUVS|nr:unnamed protein product [Eruca vesicaria subsp. sativa]